MKTNILKAAIVIVAVVITTSVEAQNTKSFRENKIANSLGKLVKENMSNLNKELKSMIMYKPEANFNYTVEANEISNIDLSELEVAAKYSPSAFNESLEFTDNNEISTVLNELKSVVKFQPTSDISEDEILDTVAQELEAVAHYYPQS